MKFNEILEEIRNNDNLELILALESLYLKTQSAINKSNSLAVKVKSKQTSKQVIQKAILAVKAHSIDSKTSAMESFSTIFDLCDDEQKELKRLF